MQIGTYTIASATFQGLGFLSGTDFYSNADDISADGSVIVGSSRDAQGNLKAFRWTQATGIVGLDLPAGNSYISGYSVELSADGSVVIIVGENDVATRFFRWTETGVTPIPNLEAFFLEDVSADTSVFVGGGGSAVRWTQASGIVDLGSLPGTGLIIGNEANGVSADGSVVVGVSYYADANQSNARNEAFRWTQASGMVGLGNLPGGLDSIATGVSADGSVIVGSSYSDARQEAFRWTQASGMVGLGDLPGGVFDSIATGVSADGSVIVGIGSTDNGRELFIWDSANGMRNLQQVLTTDFGINLTAWDLDRDGDVEISADGLTIIGSGLSPQGLTEAFRVSFSPAAPPPFDPIQYGASYGDLIQAFGFNPVAFQQHYDTSGRIEGRSPDNFDEYRYIASNSDLIGAFGLNGEAATIHYITNGYSENRSKTTFDPARYLLSQPDLLNAFGTNLSAATQHYITNVAVEGRNPNLFPSDRYIASYGDLIQAFGYNLDAGSNHYLFSGIGEGRGVLFDPQTYLNLYSDLQAAFGNNLEAATRHYIEYGFAEGRTL